MESEKLINDNGDIEKIKVKKAPVGLVILSGFSFVPAIGVFFGILSIFISLFDFKRFKLLFILGLSGITFSIVIYSALFYFSTIYRGGTYDKLRVSMELYLLQDIDKEMNNYKCKFGSFPSELKEVLKVDDRLILKDPIFNLIKEYKGDSLFYYKQTPDSFLLFSVGFDGKPFTPDDIHPNDVDSLQMKK